MEIAVVILTLVSLFLTFKVWSLERKLIKIVEMNTQFVDIVHTTTNGIFEDLMSIHKTINSIKEEKE